jgi:photosystem II stability/assembly factor-like uncharacterized protein
MDPTRNHRVAPTLRSRFVVLAISTTLVALATPARSQTTPTTRRTPPARATTKGVWEPVNYSEDLNLRSVFFVSPDEGWVSGDAGTLLHTTSAGKEWNPQLGGDPKSNEPRIELLRFVDRAHGWAVQEDKLLRTTDGEHWEQYGSIVPSMTDYLFTSPTVGFALGGLHGTSDRVYRTTDGGRTWKEMAQCAMKLEIDGLTKEVSCRLQSVHFPTPLVGYAVGGQPMCGYCNGPPLIVKTEDGGEHWRVFLGPGDVKTSMLDGVSFINEQSGVVHLAEGKIFSTSDGGATWHGLVGSPDRNVRFADPEVGWGIEEHGVMSYTTDGGGRWSSRRIVFPVTYVHAFSLPRRDRAYVVGEHGLIYRYRVVAAEEPLVAHALEAPAMPLVQTALDDNADKLTKEIAALTQRLDSASSGTSAGAQQSGGQSVAVVDNCCARAVGQIESTVGAIATDVPGFFARYRNVNLFAVGVQLMILVPQRLDSVKAAMKELHDARTVRNAGLALLAIDSSVARLRQDVRMALQLDSPALTLQPNARPNP